MVSDAGLLVAVTAGVREKGGSRNQPAAFLNVNYLEALAHAGLAPVPLTPAHPEAATRAILGACRGLVLTGGADVDPARYGQLPHPALGRVAPARDELEWRALDLARERGMPVLGICRGIQVLNAYHGGTLYQDLRSELASGITHDQGEAIGHTHEVEVVPGSRLSAMVGAGRIPVNSYHHQAVRELAPYFIATARAPDGVVEGVEARDGSWVVAIQWHPERQLPDTGDDDPERLLFAGFRAAVEAYRG